MYEGVQRLVNVTCTGLSDVLGVCRFRSPCYKEALPCMMTKRVFQNVEPSNRCGSFLCCHPHITIQFLFEDILEALEQPNDQTTFSRYTPPKLNMMGEKNCPPQFWFVGHLLKHGRSVKQIC